MRQNRFTAVAKTTGNLKKLSTELKISNFRLNSKRLSEFISIKSATCEDEEPLLHFPYFSKLLNASGTSLEKQSFYRLSIK